MTKPTHIIQDNDYKAFIHTLKAQVQSSQIKAAVAVNQELLKLYWLIGSQIVEKQKLAAWGSGFIQQVSRDLQQEFPDIKGFSYRNLRAVKQWYCFYQHDIVNLATGCSQIANEEESIVQQLVAQLEDAPIFQIPWGQNLVILSKSADIKEALFYVHKTIENNWSRAVLTHQIESGLYQRQGKAVSYDKVLCIDIQETLDTCQAWCATKVALPMNRVSQFGSEALASPVDGSVEGFCKSSHQTIVEYSLKDMHKPMGVSEYELTRHLPDNLKSSLPSIADIEAELGVGDV